MAFFNKKSSGSWKSGTDDKGGFKGGFKPNDGKFKGDRKFSATCSNCQMICEVPFKPSGSKPVFCNNCFRKEEGGAPSKRFSGAFEKPAYRSTPHPENTEVAKQLQTLNEKMDQILALLTDGGEEGEEDASN